MSKIKNIAFLLLLIGVVIVSGCVNNQTPTENSLATEKSASASFSVKTINKTVDFIGKDAHRLEILNVKTMKKEGQTLVSVYIRVKNMETEKEDFFYDESVILDNIEGQYKAYNINAKDKDVSYFNEKYYSNDDIYPGVVKEGAIDFEPIKADANRLTIIMDEIYHQYKFDIYLKQDDNITPVVIVPVVQTPEEIAKSSEQVQLFLKQYPDSKVITVRKSKEAITTEDQFTYGYKCDKELNGDVAIVTFMNSYPLAMKIVYIVDEKVDCII